MNEPVDLFVTKGVEYLLVIGFLGALLAYWRLLARRAAPRLTPLPAGPAAASNSGWFQLPLERFYHHGHGWARPDADGLVALGIDDFAQKLVGQADRIELPPVGGRVGRAAPLSRLQVGGRSVELQAPIDGEVVFRNDAVLARPGLVNDDPYGKGWLLRVRPSRWQEDAGELLSGKQAKGFLDRIEDALRAKMAPSFGLLLQDGGVPVSGIARVLAGEDWDRLAREFLDG